MTNFDVSIICGAKNDSFDVQYSSSGPTVTFSRLEKVPLNTICALVHLVQLKPINWWATTGGQMNSRAILFVIQLVSIAGKPAIHVRSQPHSFEFTRFNCRRLLSPFMAFATPAPDKRANLIIQIFVWWIFLLLDRLSTQNHYDHAMIWNATDFFFSLSLSIELLSID